jgi:hypothetical protein
MNQPSFAGFRETGPTGPVVAGVRSKRRSGVFAAKLYSSHRFKLEYDVGDSPAGTVVYASVQNWFTQPEVVRAAAKWICAFPGCAGKSWPTKQAALEEHGDWRPIEQREEAHCLLALSKLPPDVAEIVGVTCKKDTHVFVTVGRRIDLALGDQVVIGGVLTRDADPKGVHEEHACNGTWLAIPMNAKTFAVECDGNKAVFFKDPKGAKPTVILHPERPILLSDEE